MKRIIQFNPIDLQGLHFFTHNIEFSIVAASYNQWEKQQLSYLEANINSAKFNSETICKWCIHHHIQFQILYPIKTSSILKNPHRYYRYLLLKQKLKKYSL